MSLAVPIVQHAYRAARRPKPAAIKEKNTLKKKRMKLTGNPQPPQQQQKGDAGEGQESDADEDVIFAGILRNQIVSSQLAAENIELTPPRVDDHFHYTISLCQPQLRQIHLHSH